MSESIVVYTAAIGPKGQRPRGGNVKDGCRFVAFMDEGGDSGEWELVPAAKIRATARRRSRIHKIVPHRYFAEDVSIWLDNGYGLAVSPKTIVELTLGDADMAVFEHPNNDGIYSEAARLLKMRRHDPGEGKIIRAQMARYRHEGFPDDMGLAMGGVLIRRHTTDVLRLCSMWWDEIERGASRDQLSFEYCCWKTGFAVTRLPRSPHELPWNRITDGTTDIFHTPSGGVALP
jgi:hypothetical protein